MNAETTSPAEDSVNEVSDSSLLNELESQPDQSEDGSSLDDSSPSQSSKEEVLSDSNRLADNEARLQQLEKEHETLRSQYMRIAADFDNFRKRQSRDQDDLKIQLTCNTLSEILPIVDNFERARQQLDPEGEEAQALHRSYQGLYKQLVEVLKQLGVAPMRVVGQSFDPTLHEAVMREPSELQVEDVILEELQRGYHLNGRVLRHALVKVSMGPGPQGIKETDEKPQPDQSSINNSEVNTTEDVQSSNSDD